MSSQNDPQLPLSDIAYDLIAIMHRKSKAIRSYGKYIEDVQHDTKLRQALVAMRLDEQRHLEILKSHLPRLLTTK